MPDPIIGSNMQITKTKHVIINGALSVEGYSPRPVNSILLSKSAMP